MRQGLVGLVLCVVPSGLALAQSSIEGSYWLADGRAQAHAIRVSIADATQVLPRSQRVRLASELEAIAMPMRAITIRRQGDALRVHHKGARALQAPDDDTTVQLRPGLSLRQRMDGDVLEQELVRERLTQRYRYALSADGGTLTVSVTLAASGIAPVRFGLSYVRD